eukprot:3647687-Amphidinium_carterae.1
MTLSGQIGGCKPKASSPTKVTPEADATAPPQGAPSATSQGVSDVPLPNATAPEDTMPTAAVDQSAYSASARHHRHPEPSAEHNYKSARFAWKSRDFGDFRCATWAIILMHDTTMPPPPVPQPQYDIPRLVQGLLKRLEYLQRRYETRICTLEDSVHTMKQAWREQRSHNKQTKEAVKNLTNSLKERRDWVYEKMSDLELKLENNAELRTALQERLDDIENTMLQLVNLKSDD